MSRETEVTVRERLANWLDGTTPLQDYWEWLILGCDERQYETEKAKELESLICLYFCEYTNPEPWNRSVESLREECIRLLHGTAEFPVTMEFRL